MAYYEPGGGWTDETIGEAEDWQKLEYYEKKFRSIRTRNRFIKRIIIRTISVIIAVAVLLVSNHYFLINFACTI